MSKYLEALKDMVTQFAGEFTREGVVHRSTDGLSALESAFDVLGLPDPCPEDMFYTILSREGE